MQKPTRQIVRNRPAESGGIFAALAVLIAYIIGLDDPGVIAALAVVVGGVPAVITWFVVTIKGS